MRLLNALGWSAALFVALSLLSLAVLMRERRPLTGYGLGRGLLRERLPAEANHELAGHAHNLFLELALQTGLRHGGMLTRNLTDMLFVRQNSLLFCGARRRAGTARGAA
jgi:hypothetical protein